MEETACCSLMCHAARLPTSFQLRERATGGFDRVLELRSRKDEADVWGSTALDLERALNKVRASEWQAGLLLVLVPQQVRRGERIVSLFQTGPGQAGTS